MLFDAWLVRPRFYLGFRRVAQVWARRQAHETAIHRYDAESASGDVNGFDLDFAVDGIDEILVGFAPLAPADLAKVRTANFARGSRDQ